MNKIRFAVDLGTTMVDCCLYDNGENKIISQKSFKNPESLYGSDVINRINATIKHRENLFKMQQLISDSLYDIFKTMLSESGLNAESVCAIVVAGNTTMISILLGIDISGMGSFPFAHELGKSRVVNAKDILWEDNDISAPVIVSGCCGAFLGGDILSGLAYITNMQLTAGERDKVNMLIDLGTNGEMVVYDGKNYIATSTSCGPAFENCTRRQNAYGTSTIDAISMLIKSGKLSKDGILKDEYIENGIDIMQININADIINSIILAKAAIRAGLELLLIKMNLTPDMVENVYLAGGFGFYLNIKNACDIGLVPKEFAEKIKVVGNSSLKGACLYESQDFDYFIDKMDVIQLANEDKYQTKLIEYMNFC